MEPNTLIYTISIIIIVSLALIAIKIDYTLSKRHLKREEYINKLEYSDILFIRLKKYYTELNDKQINQIIDNLKSFFLLVLNNKGKQVAMPSQAVDVAWHEFILCTKDYADFCQKAFGKFLHHTPTERMNSSTDATDGIINTWKLACEYEDIDPENPSKIPDIFTIDSELNIKNGFHYVFDCDTIDGNNKYCVAHIANQYKNSRSNSGSSCSSGCGGD